MLIIFLSWIVLFYFFITFGAATEILLKLNPKNSALTVLLGMVSQTVFISTAAFFVPIGFSFFIANFILTTLFAILFRRRIADCLILLKNDYMAFGLYSKIIILITLLTAVFKCAQPPFILDNESYYIQTIKWLNEYGYVKGLANFNIAFGQTSTWQILQSGFNFSFITNRINDINGFLLVCCSFYFIGIFDACLKKGKAFHWIGFVLVFNVLSFQFINSPSPDIPLFLMAQIVFFQFLKNDRTTEDIRLLILLLLYLVFIKITIAPLGLLLLFVFYKERKGWFFTLSTGLVFGMIWIAKNIILTGYPLYPFAYFPIHENWAIPEKLLASINSIIRDHEFLEIKGYKNLNIIARFKAWIAFGGINSIFNKGIIILFLVAPFTRRMRNNNAYKMLYFVLLIHFLFVFVISPQFRFFLAAFIFLSALVIADIAERLRMNRSLVFGTLAVAVILPLFVMYFINLKSLTSNKFNQQDGQLSLKQLYLPEKNSKFGDMVFEKIHKDSLYYYSPKINFFIYGTADGPLPCTNKNEMDYFEKHLGIFPQLRTKELKDGFYSKPVANSKKAY